MYLLKNLKFLCYIRRINKLHLEIKNPLDESRGDALAELLEFLNKDVDVI